jgi:Secretion system C-terminal sorting domain
VVHVFLQITIFLLTKHNNQTMQQLIRLFSLILCFTLAASSYASAQCNIEGTITNKRCNDNGTSTPDDDTFSFDFTGTGSGSNGYDLFVGSWNGKSYWNYFGNSVSVGPFRIKDGNVTLIVAINGNANCNKTISVPPTAPCSVAPCDINYSVSNNVCNDNGTPCDASDDTFTFEVNGTGTGSNGYDLFLGGWGGKQYWNYFGQSVKIGPFKIKDGAVNFIIARNGDPACNKTFSVTPPATCSKNAKCDIDGVVSNKRCDSNGTDCDETDDVFYFDITPTGSACNGFVVAVGGKRFDSNGAAVKNLGPFKISSGFVGVKVLRNGDDCVKDVWVEPTPPCSKYAKCDIGGTASNQRCDDNGTPCNVADDNFYFDFTATGNACKGYFIEAGGKRYSADNITDVIKNVGPFKIAGGAASVKVYRTGYEGCNATVSVTPAPSKCGPPPCKLTGAEVCFIRTDYAGQEPSPFDTRDDQFQFLLKVTGSDPAAKYQVYVDNRLYIESKFGESYWFRFPISKGNFDITVKEVGNACCSIVVPVTPPALNRSTVPCNASAYITGISCDPLSTKDYPGDDKFTFDVQAYDGSMFGNQNYEVYITSYTQAFYNYYYADGYKDTNWKNWRGGWANVATAAYGSKVNVGKFYIRDFGAGTKLAVVVARKGDPACFRLYTMEVPQPCSLNPCRQPGATENVVENIAGSLNAGDALNAPAKIAIANNTTEKVAISPNPAHDRITIATAGWDGETTAHITNIEGKLMKQIQVLGNSRMEVNLTDFAQGVYFLQINNGKSVTTEKFIVK